MKMTIMATYNTRQALSFLGLAYLMSIISALESHDSGFYATEQKKVVSPNNRLLMGAYDYHDYDVCPEGFAKFSAEWNVCLSDYPYHHFRWDLYDYPGFQRLAHEYTSSFPSHEVVHEKFSNKFEACLETRFCYEFDLLWAKVPLGVLDVSQLSATYDGEALLVEEFDAYEDTSWIFTIFGNCDGIEDRRRELVKNMRQEVSFKDNVRAARNSKIAPEDDSNGHSFAWSSTSELGTQGRDLLEAPHQPVHSTTKLSKGSTSGTASTSRGKNGGKCIKSSKSSKSSGNYLRPGKDCPKGLKKFTASWAGLNFNQEEFRRLAVDIYEFQNAGASENDVNAFKSIVGEETYLDPSVLPSQPFPDSIKACLSDYLCYEFDIIWRGISANDGRFSATYDGQELTFQNFGGPGQVFTRFPIGCMGTLRTNPFDPQDYLQDAGLDF